MAVHQTKYYSGAGDGDVGAVDQIATNEVQYDQVHLWLYAASEDVILELFNNSTWNNW